MTKKKKTIIIIVAIVAALVAWLLWRRKSGGNAADAYTPQQASRLEQLIEGAGLNSVEADLVRNFNPTGSYKDFIYTSALQQGIDYESSLLLNCLWNRYRSGDTFVNEASEARYRAIYNKVKAMN